MKFLTDVESSDFDITSLATDAFLGNTAKSVLSFLSTLLTKLKGWLDQDVKTTAKPVFEDITTKVENYSEWFCDCDNVINPIGGRWHIAAISTGTITNNAILPNKEHRGVISLSSSATANSGYYVITSAGKNAILGGGEAFKCCFMVSGTGTSTNTGKYGFQDVLTSAVPANGAWINIANTTVSGKTAKASAVSTTGTTYTIVTAVWYTAEVIVNSNATLITFNLYDDQGTLLWTQTLSTNIPITFVGDGVVATNSGTAAVVTAYLDYLKYKCTRKLIRS